MRNDWGDSNSSDLFLIAAFLTAMGHNCRRIFKYLVFFNGFFDLKVKG
jgi:hypothetical protein